VSWVLNGVERVVSGSLIRFGDHRGDSAQVHQTPREVYEIMEAARYSTMIELSHHGDPTVPVYLDRRQIVSIIPLWAVVEDK